MERTRRRTVPLRGLPSLNQLSACTSSSKSRTEAIFSAPPKAGGILWKSGNASWPDDAEQNKSVTSTTDREKRGRDGGTMLGVETTRQNSVPSRMGKERPDFNTSPYYSMGGA